MVQGFLLKYAEIGIKGKNRYKFENALCEQARIKLSKIGRASCRERVCEYV